MDDDTRGEPVRRYDVPWSLHGDEATATPDDTLVIDLSEASVHPDRHAHCPACQGRRMEAVVTGDGLHYEHCEGCGRLWEDHDGRFDLVLDVKVLDRRGAT